jgi:hypothetical protein
MDEVIGPDVGSATTFTEYGFITDADDKAWRKEINRRAKRRIKPGFALPANRKDTE